MPGFAIATAEIRADGGPTFHRRPDFPSTRTVSRTPEMDGPDQGRLNPIIKTFAHSWITLTPRDARHMGWSSSEMR